jgi:hypothetical protein
VNLGAMPDVRILRQLDVAPEGDKPRHLSAASGLVRVDRHLFVVADDEMSLGLFDLSSDREGRLFRLFAGGLPRSHKERKAVKPDFEALAFLPACADRPFGTLLALGSGSRPNRQRGALVDLDAKGEPQDFVREIDLEPLFAPLHERFADLNIEGAFIEGRDLCLLQRGNSREPVNACIRFAWSDVEQWLYATGAAPAARSVRDMELGHIDGVPVCLTDGVALARGGWAFCAAAEDTSDSYADGRCLGSVVGVVDRAGDILAKERLALVCKTEGIAVLMEGTSLELLLVTDADDRSTPAFLLSATLALGEAARREVH